MWRCSDELKQRVVILEAHAKKEAKHYIEFWKHIPPNEPFRVLLGDMRDKLYNTRERMRQLLANGKSDINIEDTFTDATQVWSSDMNALHTSQNCVIDFIQKSHLAEKLENMFASPLS